MNNNSRWGGITLLLVGAIGCGISEAPNGNAGGSQASQETAQMAEATLHINGFKKSKSGALGVETRPPPSQKKSSSTGC